MYSNVNTRWVMLVLLLVGLWPLFSVAFYDADIAGLVLPVLLWKIVGGALIAAALTLLFYSLTGQKIAPLWITAGGAAAIFVAASLVAGWFSLFWFIAMFGLVWGLGYWLLELPRPAHGAALGAIFVLARLGGIALAATQSASVLPQ